MLRIIRKIWPVFFIVLATAFMWRYVESNRGVLTNLLQPSPYYVLLALLFQLLNWLLNVKCWQHVAALAAGAKISDKESLRHLALITMGKYIPGKVWGLLARASSMRRNDISIQQIATATLQEQLSLLHAAVVVCAVLICWLFPTWATMSMLLLAMLSVLIAPSLQRHLCRLLQKLSKGRELLQKLSVVPALNRDGMCVLLAGYVSIWVSSGVIFASLYFAIFPNKPSVELTLALLLANTVGILAGFAALFAPGGLGVREVVASGMLIPYMPIQDALAAGIVFRIWTAISELLTASSFLIPDGKNDPSSAR